MDTSPDDSHYCELCDNSIAQLQQSVASTEGLDRARALIQLGDAAIFSLRDDLALASFGACLDLVADGDAPDIQCAALYKESCVLAAIGRYDDAIERITKAESICERLGDLEHLSLCEWRHGMYLQDLGETAPALKLIKGARDRYLELDLLAMATMVEHDLQMVRTEDKRKRSDRR